MPTRDQMGWKQSQIFFRCMQAVLQWRQKSTKLGWDMCGNASEYTAGEMPISVAMRFWNELGSIQ